MLNSFIKADRKVMSDYVEEVHRRARDDKDQP